MGEISQMKSKEMSYLGPSKCGCGKTAKPCKLCSSARSLSLIVRNRLTIMDRERFLKSKDLNSKMKSSLKLVS